MIYDWTTEIDIKQDNVLEIAVPESIEGEIVQGDRLRVRVIVEEVLVDGEEEALRKTRKAKSRWENEGGRVIPWEATETKAAHDG